MLSLYFVQFKLLFHGLVCHQLLPLFLSLLPESRLLYFHSFAQSLLDLVSTEVVHKLCNHQPIRLKLSEYHCRRPNKLTFDNFSFFVNTKNLFCIRVGQGLSIPYNRIYNYHQHLVLQHPSPISVQVHILTR